MNDKGCKPLELAIRNQHIACQEILSQYTLHYQTHSNFDSVLFIAALEGHKHIKQSILPNNSNSNHSLQRNKSNSNNKSLFSLKTKKTMKMQRWGAWIAYEDNSTHNIYWYNHEELRGQWEKPEEVTKLQEEVIDQKQVCFN